MMVCAEIRANWVFLTTHARLHPAGNKRLEGEEIERREKWRRRTANDMRSEKRSIEMGGFKMGFFLNVARKSRLRG